MVVIIKRQHTLANVYLSVILQRFLKQLLLLSTVFLLSACEPPNASQATKQSDKNKTRQTVLSISDEQAEILANSLWQQGLAALEANRDQAKNLEEAINQFLKTPEQKELEKARTAWRGAFLAYQRITPFLFIQHTGFSPLEKWRFTLAAWPLQPGYLDSYGPYLHSGIIHDISLVITKETLRNQHGLTDNEELTLGLHPIEFILWSGKVNSAKKRFAYQTKVPLALAQSGLKQEELPNNRRRQLLKLQGLLFASDSESLVQQWQTNGVFAATFQQLSPMEKLIALNSSLRARLETLTKLLIKHGDPNNEDNLYYDTFAGNRLATIADTVSTIHSLYFSSNTDNTLAKALFSSDQQQPLSELLQTAEKQLLNKKNTSNQEAADTLNEVLVLLNQ